MKCPNDNSNLKKAVFYNVEIDYCPRCLGIWFDRDELRQAKDARDKELNWLDIDLWKHEEHFKISSISKICPYCSVPLYETKYGDSDIAVDVCNLCEGIWLDRGEFKKIIDYLKETGSKKILNDYFKTLIEEFAEVFTGPETFQEELADFLMVLKLLKYKFATQHPKISQIISSLPA